MPDSITHSSEPFISEFEKYEKMDDWRRDWRLNERETSLQELRDNRGNSKRAHVRRALRMIPELEKCEDLLEVGCGNGWLLEHLHYDRRMRVTGIEPSGSGYAICLSKKLPVISQSVYDIPTMNWRPGDFDGVLMMEIIEHLQWPERALMCVDHLQPKWIWMTTPHIRMEKGPKGPLPVLRSCHHLREFSPASLKEFVEVALPDYQAAYVESDKYDIVARFDRCSSSRDA